MAKTPTERTLEWRKKNPEKYREYQKVLMRKKRGSSPTKKDPKKPLTNTTATVSNVTNEKPVSVFDLMKTKIQSSPTVIPRGTAL